jgi:hypothetical protein
MGAYPETMCPNFAATRQKLGSSHAFAIGKGCFGFPVDWQKVGFFIEF